MSNSVNVSKPSAAVKSELTHGFECQGVYIYRFRGVDVWRNPQTWQVRLFDRTKPRYCEVPIPSDDNECVEAGPWILLAGGEGDIE
jgi:hypothetical protein